MKKGNLTFLLLFTLFSCSTVTKEQEEKFTNCRDNLSGLSATLLLFESEIKYGSDFIHDLKIMSLEELLEKYNIPYEETDKFIEYICGFRTGKSNLNIETNEKIKPYDVTKDTLFN